MWCKMTPAGLCGNQAISGVKEISTQNEKDELIGELCPSLHSWLRVSPIILEGLSLWQMHGLDSTSARFLRDDWISWSQNDLLSPSGSLLTWAPVSSCSNVTCGHACLPRCLRAHQERYNVYSGSFNAEASLKINNSSDFSSYQYFGKHLISLLPKTWFGSWMKDLLTTFHMDLVPELDCDGTGE